VRPFGLGKVSL